MVSVTMILFFVFFTCAKSDGENKIVNLTTTLNVTNNSNIESINVANKQAPVALVAARNVSPPRVNDIMLNAPDCPKLENLTQIELMGLTQSELLSRLTNDCRYDKLERPLAEIDEDALPVSTRVYVYFIQSTEAHDLQFSVHILLQFRYVDRRLAYQQYAPHRPVIMGEAELRDKIWVPHVFLANERSSQIMGADNKLKDVLVSISPNGTVIVSTRMQARLYCWMNLQKFPFDEQRCSVILESWMYNTSELDLSWEVRSPVTLAPELHLTEYILTSMFTNDTVITADMDNLRHGAFSGNFSSLSFTFVLGRQVGFYLMDYFIPSILIVTISWVTFWLAADQSAPRIMLGCSTMLTFITLASAQGKTLPKVSYIKASEIWFLGCTGFIFGTLVEFAFVNTIWRRKKNVELKKVNSKYILKSTLTPKLARKELNASRQEFGSALQKSRSCSSLDVSNQNDNNAYNSYLTVHSFPSKLNLPTITTQSVDDLISTDTVSVTIDGTGSTGANASGSSPPPNLSTGWTTMTPQEISMWIDTRSRLVFPCAFIVFNAFYWTFVYYL